MMVVFLGADGSGKSSVIRRLGEAMGDVFGRRCCVHLRPGLGRSARGDAPAPTNPHASPPRGWFGSVLKLVYLLVDYTAGYAWKVRPLCRNGLVLFDRYYHDLLVDPRRYRYGGPMWLARWAARLVPKPDLFVLLDAPVEALRARKQEVARSETTRQRTAYLDLVRRLGNGHVVDASAGLDEVVAEVRRIVVGAPRRSAERRVSFVREPLRRLGSPRHA
jgi:thymidylate kinase